MIAVLLTLIPPADAILLVALAVLVIAWGGRRFTQRIIASVETVGQSYTDLYQQQHREVMEALSAETRKAIADTKALVMEHTELERILRVLAERDEENQERREAADERRQIADDERAGHDEARAGMDEARSVADEAREGP